MSVSKWAYTPEMCDGDICVGDCDLCDKPKIAQIHNTATTQVQTDYIKRDAVIDYLESNNMPWRDWVKDIPSADVVEVVRCKDCEHFEAINNDDHGWCKSISDLPCGISVRYDDDFCSFGERAEA